MKKLFWFTAALLVLSSLAFFTVVPRIVDSSLNHVAARPSREISSRATRLHRQLRIVDLHADSLLWGRDILKRAGRGEVDVPRLLEGNVALQTFTAVTKTPRGINYERNAGDTDNIFWLGLAQRWPPRTWNSLAERALYQASEFDDAVSRSGGKLVAIRTSDDLANYLRRRETETDITAGLLGVEGAHALDGKLDNLDRLFAAGYRYVSLTHFFDDEFAGSSSGVKKGGLTPAGRELVRKMNKMGVIIDLAHTSPQTIADVLQETKRPVIYSHGGLQGSCKNRRNLSDEEARGIAQTGGIVGVGFWPTAVCGRDAKAIAAAIRYAVNLVGIDHVALGSDFDGAVTTPFDAAHMPELTDALLKEGFSEGEIHAVMGENALRFLSKNLPN